MEEDGKRGSERVSKKKRGAASVSLPLSRAWSQIYRGPYCLGRRQAG